MDAGEFYADSMLGKTARWLRLMGFSVEYATPDMKDDEIIRQCEERNMFLLTRDRDLTRRYAKSMYMASDDYHEQVKHFLTEFKADEGLYFTRCPLCNSELKVVPADEYSGEVPEDVKKRYQVLHICDNCGKVYWEGSHFDSILATLRNLNSGAEE